MAALPAELRTHCAHAHELEDGGQLVHQAATGIDQPHVQPQQMNIAKMPVMCQQQLETPEQPVGLSR
jgi:hypothetical protein